MPHTTVIPVNYREPDARPEAIARDVDYAVQVGLAYLHWIADALATSDRTLSAVRGLDVFELGPGPSLGPAVLLACGGARVTVCDRFAARWDNRYHPAVFEALLPRVEQLLPGSGTPIIRLLDARAFVPDVIDVRECPAEELGRLAGGRADIVISNAVLEHVMDVPRAFAGLAHVGRPGSVGIHQVDFRDHRNFSKPLEYLTLSSTAFEEIFAEQMGECGNRWRPRPMAAAFEAAGFTVRALQPNMWAEADYVAGIKPRLHPDVAPIEDVDLFVISAQFVVERRRRT